MTKDDRKFMVRLINQLDQKLSRKIDTLDQKIDGVHYELLAEIRANTDEIRYNGVLIEENAYHIGLLSEGHQSLAEQIGRLQAGMEDIQEKTNLIPVIFTTVQDHSRRLAAWN